MDSEILDRVTKFYINSADFNGISVYQLIAEFKAELDVLKNIFISLIQQDKISLVFGDGHPNPHIKAFDEDNQKTQIEKLQDTKLLAGACVYPSRSVLNQVIDPSDYIGKPFTLRLALGEPQLSYVSFDLRVLETYRNDPRYYYSTDDIHGEIGTSDEYYDNSEEMPASDRALIETFGFSYDEQLRRAVAVYLRYLTKMSPEHQQIWNARIVRGAYKLHPDYFKSTMGIFPDGASIFDAFIEEQLVINEMCNLMGRPVFFRKTLDQYEKPREFSFLIRPTLKEFNKFAHLMDKLISENINKEFFLNDIPLEREETRKKDGKIVVQQKGTLQLLEDWLSTKLQVSDRQPITEMIETFKKIRKLRQKPAHGLDDDKFNQQYFEQQRKLITKAYEGVRLLRLIFTNHPNVKDYEVPEWLYSGKIWTY